MKVAVLECRDYTDNEVTESLHRGIGLLGGWEAFVKPGMTVLLKINLIGPKPPESAAVTHCEFVRYLTRILKGLGCDVWIGDSAGGAIAGIAPTGRGMDVSGMTRVADEEGAIIKNFEREGVVEVATPHGIQDRIFLAKPVFDADFVINVPKLKTHSSAIFTGAVKNVFGMIPGLRKAEYHRIAPDPEDFGQVLYDIHAAAKIGLHIMDGVVAMQGEGPTAGKPYEAHKILMSADPLALDIVAVSMLGLRADDVPVFTASRKHGLGEDDLGKIEIVGDYQEPPALRGFAMPRRMKSGKKRSGKAMSSVIKFFKTYPIIDRKLCKNCNTCVESCPVKAIDKQTKAIDYNACIECLCCHELCMYKAVKLKSGNPVAGVIKRMVVR